MSNLYLLHFRFTKKYSTFYKQTRGTCLAIHLLWYRKVTIWLIQITLILHMHTWLFDNIFDSKINSFLRPNKSHGKFACTFLGFPDKLTVKIKLLIELLTSKDSRCEHFVSPSNFTWENQAKQGEGRGEDLSNLETCQMLYSTKTGGVSTYTN